MNMSVFTEIKERVMFIDVAQEYGIQLKRKGSHYVCLCPFHQEKTPSMVIYEDGYKCFGCGQAGDIISFISELQGLKPIDAAKDIIQRCGLPIAVDNQYDATKRAKQKKYNSKNFLDALERWRDKTFPIYVEWYKAIDANIKKMNMNNSLFQALIELKSDLDYITEQLISDNFMDVLDAYKFTQGTMYEL